MILRLIRSLAMKHLFAALSAGIALVAVSGVASAEEPADPQAGFEYAQTYCATCHATGPALQERGRPAGHHRDRVAGVDANLPSHHAQHYRRAERHA
jgi:hypothetical protein